MQILIQQIWVGSREVCSSDLERQGGRGPTSDSSLCNISVPLNVASLRTLLIYPKNFLVFNVTYFTMENLKQETFIVPTPYLIKFLSQGIDLPLLRSSANSYLWAQIKPTSRLSQMVAKAIVWWEVGFGASLSCWQVTSHFSYSLPFPIFLYPKANTYHMYILSYVHIKKFRGIQGLGEYVVWS